MGALGKHFKQLEATVEEKAKKVEEQAHGDKELKQLLNAMQQAERLTRKLMEELEKSDQQIEQGNDKRAAESAGEAMHAAKDLMDHLNTIYQLIILENESLADEISKTNSSLVQIAHELEQFKESEGVKTPKERIE